MRRLFVAYYERKCTKNAVYHSAANAVFVNSYKLHKIYCNPKNYYV